MSGQKRGMDQLKIAQQGKDKGKFKDEAEGESEPHTERDIFFNGDHGFDRGRLISHEETDAEGKGDEITEEGPEIEEENGGQRNKGRRFQSPSPKKGRESFPEMIKDDRHGKEEAGKERQLKNGEKGLGNAIGDQILLERAMEMTEQLLGKRKEHGPDEDDRSNNMEETFSQTTQRFKQLFPFDFHSDSFLTNNTESNLT
jgi:hypothetical protein